MLIGYARTSTTEQVAGIEAQERDLLANGCERIFREQTSSIGQRHLALKEDARTKSCWKIWPSLVIGSRHPS